MLLLTLSMFWIGSGDIPPYFVGFVQERTLFSREEPIRMAIRLGNQSESPLKARKFPDLFGNLTLKRGEEVFHPVPEAKSSDLYKRLPALEINAHRDFRMDLRKIFSQLNEPGEYQLFYADPIATNQSLAFKIVDQPNPNLDEPFVLHTSMGDITIKLSPKDAPNHCRNFALLVQEGFYKDMIFHRVVRGQIIQTGDPLGTGAGGSGFPLMLEDSPFLRHKAYNVGMARAQDRDSASSQFYILAQDIPELNNYYTVFASVIQGQEVVDAISMVGTTGPNGNPPEKPFEDVKLINIEQLAPAP
ncbi:MAG: peptidylprolyl isomerase [Acidobacteria bacterium]|nr:peptidylprolyl isomerase [Acidobacteriota bacterium]MCB9396312.1 peptidylprolyl isomerase [Acidobacteriota bacterium]